MSGFMFWPHKMWDPAHRQVLDYFRETPVLVPLSRPPKRYMDYFFRDTIALNLHLAVKSPILWLTFREVAEEVLSAPATSFIPSPSLHPPLTRKSKPPPPSQRPMAYGTHLQTNPNPSPSSTTWRRPVVSFN